MPVDPSLRAALDRADGRRASAAAEPDPDAPLDPLAEMRRLVRSTKDSRTKARLLTLLRAEEREAASRPDPDGDLSEVATEELQREADEWTATALSSVLHETTLAHLWPMTRQVLAETMDRKVAEGVAAELAAREDAGEFDRRVDARARELAEPIAEQLAAERVEALRAELGPAPAPEPEHEPEPREPEFDPIPPGIRDDRGWS